MHEDILHPEWIKSDYKSDLEPRLLAYLLRYSELKLDSDANRIEAESFVSQMIRKTSKGDAILKIGQLAPEFSLTHILDSQTSFKDVVVENNSPTVIESLNNSFLQTSSMKRIENIEWPSNLTEYSYLKESPVVSDEINEFL